MQQELMNKINQIQVGDLNFFDEETKELFLESQKLYEKIIEKLERKKIK